MDGMYVDYINYDTQALLRILMDPGILGWSCPDPDPGFAITKKDNFHITSFF